MYSISGFLQGCSRRTGIWMNEVEHDREHHHTINTMAEAGGDHNIIIEFDALANELEKMMNTTNLTMSTKCCIFKVPNILSRHSLRAYTPNAFSIGPYHYGKEHLKATQKIKLRYLHDLISSFPGINPKAMLRTLIGAIREVQEDARDCYADPFDHISMDEFVKILVLDGCFLIELFRKKALKDLREESEDDDPVLPINPQIDGDPIFMMSCMLQFLHHDLILLENQIPWRVLSVLFDITKERDGQPQCLSLQVLHSGVFGTLASDIEIYSEQWSSTEDHHKHILDMLRNAMVSSSTIAQGGSSEWKSMPSAARLSEAGIKFKTGTSSKSILDIKFKEGVLEIPQLQIEEDSESLIRNLICLEQCLPNCPHIVTSYAILVDNLINTSRDMEILCESGIIDNWLNVDDATKFFNQLYDDACVKKVYYTPLIKEVKEYCQRWWPRHRTILMLDYFRNTWALISVIAAAFLLILTFLQTVFSIIK